MTPRLALLEPRSIVLMGASEAEGFGAAVASNLRGSRFAGGVFLIGSDDSVPPAELAYRDVRELR
jgi:hypothetical protein